MGYQTTGSGSGKGYIWKKARKDSEKNDEDEVAKEADLESN